MKPSFFEVRIPSGVDASELAGVLEGSDFLGAWEQDGLIRLYWQGAREDILEKVSIGLRQMGMELSREVMALFEVKVQDWNAQWAASVQPVRVGRRFLIRPSWSSPAIPDGAIELIVDPQQAFGTGHHATTQLLLEWLEDVEWHPGARVLDVGTGSGILCMGALRLGATSALGIDIDSTAIACAKGYARTNHFHNDLEFAVMRLVEVPRQDYSVILANVDRRTLLALCQDFSRLRSAKTSLVLSGILQEDQEEIRIAYQAEGWRYEGNRTRDDWVAIQFGAPSSGDSSSGSASKYAISAS